MLNVEKFIIILMSLQQQFLLLTKSTVCFNSEKKLQVFNLEDN